MNLNQEFLKTLPPHISSEIDILIYKLQNEIINIDEFYQDIGQLIGDDGLNNLFNNIKGKDIKTEKLVDVIEYSGVDLKRETDIFNKDSVKQLREYDDSYLFETDGDIENNYELDELLDINLFSDYLQKLCNSRQIGIKAECIKYFFKGLKNKLSEIIEKADFASKIRTDYVKQQFNLQLKELNDVKKQLFVLEEEDKLAMTNLREKNPIELEDVIEIKPEHKEREDVLIKKKMANTLALEALGSKKTEFIDFEDESLTETKKNYPLVNLFNEESINEMERKIKTRRITVEDIIFVLENDPNYEKSLFVIQHYFK